MMEESVTDLVPSLAKILREELLAGNVIAENTYWPPDCECLVILRHRFVRRHPLDNNIEFVVLNDAHYWHSEYRYRNGTQILACRHEQ